MNEEKINQILRNQATILLAITDDSYLDIDTLNSVNERMNETKQLLNPTNNKSAVEKEQERTKEFFEEEVRSKFGTRKK